MKQGLNSFRALAFLAVFFGHVGGFNAGYIGVLAFFVLSGFLLTPILIEMKRDLPTPEFFVNFYGRRALRIFPLYYLYLLGIAAIAYFVVTRPDYSSIRSIERFFAQLPWALTYSYNFYHASNNFQHTHLLTHFWSLAVEEQFYLFWPLVIFVTPVRRYPAILLSLILAGPVIRQAIILIHASQWIGGLQRYPYVLIYVLPFSHMDAFAMGGYFALTRKRVSNGWIGLLVLLILGLGYGTEWRLFHKIYFGSLGYLAFMFDSYKYLWGYSLWSLCFACILVQLRHDAFLPLLFNNAILGYLGKISYGLYVFHYPILWWIKFQFPALSWNLWILFALSATILLSVLSYELFESRLIARKDRYFAKIAAKPTLSPTIVTAKA